MKYRTLFAIFFATATVTSFSLAQRPEDRPRPPPELPLPPPPPPPPPLPVPLSSFPLQRLPPPPPPPQQQQQIPQNPRFPINSFEVLNKDRIRVDGFNIIERRTPREAGNSPIELGFEDFNLKDEDIIDFDKEREASGDEITQSPVVADSEIALRTGSDYRVLTTKLKTSIILKTNPTTEQWEQTEETVEETEVTDIEVENEVQDLTSMGPQVDLADLMTSEELIKATRPPQTDDMKNSSGDGPLHIHIEISNAAPARSELRIFPTKYGSNRSYTDYPYTPLDSETSLDIFNTTTPSSPFDLNSGIVIKEQISGSKSVEQSTSLQSVEEPVHSSGQLQVHKETNPFTFSERLDEDTVEKTIENNSSRHENINETTLTKGVSLQANKVDIISPNSPVQQENTPNQKAVNVDNSSPNAFRNSALVGFIKANIGAVLGAIIGIPAIIIFSYFIHIRRRRSYTGILNVTPNSYTLKKTAYKCTSPSCIEENEMILTPGRKSIPPPPPPLP